MLGGGSPHDERMRTRGDLPRRLGERFTVGAADAAGVGRARRDAEDLARPFYGVRARTAPTTLFDVVACCTMRLKPGHRYGGRTAMRLWGLPLPRRWTPNEPVEVLVEQHQAPPKAAGVTGRRLGAHRARTMILQGQPVVDPIAAFFSAASTLTVAQAVVVIDALVTTFHDYPGLGPGRPMATLPEIAARLVEWGRFLGSGTIRAALPFARERVESPKETETRLLLTAAGLPEPIVQFVIRDRGRFIARVDLAYPALKIAIEYEGDGHRTDRQQWRIDIRRQRELEARGWIVIRLTEADLADGGASLLGVLRHAFSVRQSAGWKTDVGSEGA